MNPGSHRQSGCWCRHGSEAHVAYDGGVGCRPCAIEPALEMTEPMLERRREERVSLTRPLRTSIAGSAAHVVDASVGGLGMMHQGQALPRGAECRLLFYSEFGPIRLDCEVARSAPSQDAIADGAWRTGIKIVSIDAESEARLRRLLATTTEH